MSIERLLAPRERDIGEFTVRRALPHASGRRVGPFVIGATWAAQGWLAAVPCADAGSVSEAAMDVALRDARVRVLPTLAPAAQARSRAALAVEIDVLPRSLPPGTEVERRFETVPALALVVDREGLEPLAAAPGVDRG